MAAADNKLNFKSYSIFTEISGTAGGSHVAQSRIGGRRRVRGPRTGAALR